MCNQLWSALGERNHIKELLVERLLFQLRWWIKSTVWSDDRASNFGRDVYLGEMVENVSPATDNGNKGFLAPNFRIEKMPKIVRMESELESTFEHWPWFRDAICAVDYGVNVCAPKAFRSLEKILVAIGKEAPNGKDEDVPNILLSEHTYPNQDEACRWWPQFLSALRHWWKKEQGIGNLDENISHRLGEWSPLKAWLIKLYVRRLELHGGCSETARLVKPLPEGRHRHLGNRPISVESTL